MSAATENVRFIAKAAACPCGGTAQLKAWSIQIDDAALKWWACVDCPHCLRQLRSATESESLDAVVSNARRAWEGAFGPSQAEVETRQRIKESARRIIANMERIAEAEQGDARQAMQQALDLERQRLLAPRLAARLHAELDAAEQEGGSHA